MPTNKQITKINKRFEVHPEGRKQIEDAYTIIKAILDLDIQNRMKEKVIDQMIWNITGAHEKYLTRFRSEETLSTKDVKLNHEHVYTRKYLIKELMGNTRKVDEVLELAIGCVVSVHEHNLLKEVEKENPKLVGWDRYKEAGIKVRDMKTDKELKIK